MNYILLRMYNIFRRFLKKIISSCMTDGIFFLIGKKERAFKELYILVLSTEKQDLTLTTGGDPLVSETNP